jgi:hypothetical protein
MLRQARVPGGFGRRKVPSIGITDHFLRAGGMLAAAGARS